MIEPLPPDLARLLAAERGAPTASTAVREAVRAKLATSIGTSAITAAGVLKILTIVAVIATGAALTVRATTSESVAQAAPVSLPVVDIEPALVALPDAAVAQEASPPEAPLPATKVAPRREVRVELPAPLPSASPSQASLLAAATRALATDPAAALRIVEEDTRIHANGSLSEEREALRLHALLALGRPADARTAARALLARFPSTVHRSLVTRALTSETP